MTTLWARLPSSLLKPTSLPGRNTAGENADSEVLISAWRDSSKIRIGPTDSGYPAITAAPMRAPPSVDAARFASLHNTVLFSPATLLVAPLWPAVHGH
jgi:hypothetical protein